MPSEITWANVCRSRLCTVIGRTSVNSAVPSPTSVMSVSTDSRSVVRGAGVMRSTLVAQQSIARSSCNAVFYVRVCYGEHFLVGHAIMSYHDRKAVDRAPMDFEGPVEGLCSWMRSAFLDQICFGSDRYCIE